MRRIPGAEDGFTLLEAMVALAVVAMVVLGYLGIRTAALMDATEARNWRLAREIAEEKLSELRAGARDLPPESGQSLELEKYPGFRFVVLVGELAVSTLEGDLAAELGAGEEAGERAQWQQDRDAYRRASQKGLSAFDYQDLLRQQEYERERQEKVPAETDLEDVAVVVYFPRVRGDLGGEDAFVLKAKVSTLALSGLTPEKADLLARSRGETVQAGNQPPGSGAGSPTTEGGRE